MNEISIATPIDAEDQSDCDQFEATTHRDRLRTEYDDGNPATVFAETDRMPDKNGRWANVRRNYTAADVERLRGSFRIRHTVAEDGARKLWQLLQTEEFVPTFGAFTGNQAVQHAKAGLKAIYLSGWQVAADANSAGQMYPDQSLYPVDSVPAVIRRMNQALRRADEIQHLERCDGESDERVDYRLPIIADAEAGFGGPLNAFELAKAMIEAGASGIHYEDQLASEKKCGHLGG